MGIEGFTQLPVWFHTVRTSGSGSALRRSPAKSILRPVDGLNGRGRGNGDAAEISLLRALCAEPRHPNGDRNSKEGDAA